jgi:hypothetical protein
MNDEQANQPNIFLSHRESDSKIASAVSKTLNDLGFEKITDYSGSKEVKRLSIGENLDKEVAKACHESNLFILIYTQSDENWEWCMFETGLAIDAGVLSGRQETGGTEDRISTKIVVLQCAEEEPKVFEGKLRVKITISSIQQFIEQLCTQDDFIPGFKAKYQKGPKSIDQMIETAARELHEKLESAISAYAADEVWRWDWFKLKISVEDIKGFESKTEDEQKQLIYNHAVAIEGFGQALAHFSCDPPRNFDSSQRYKIGSKIYTFAYLIEAWNDVFGLPKDSRPAWSEELVREIAKAIKRRSATPQMELMKSATQHPNDWFYPILNHVRWLRNGGVEFQIYMYRFQHDFPWFNPDALSVSSES